MDSSRERMLGGRRVARALGDYRFRAALFENGYESEHQIILCLFSDSTIQLIERAERYEAPVAVAAYEPRTDALIWALIHDHEARTPPFAHVRPKDNLTVGRLFETLSKGVIAMLMPTSFESKSIRTIETIRGM